LLHRLAAVDAGARTAPWTVLAVALFPTGFFLLAPYTESLFLAFSAGTFVALRADRPWLAGLAAVGASFTRPLGFVLAIPIAVYAIRRVRASRRLDVALATLPLPLVGFVFQNVYATSIGLPGSILSLQPLWGVRMVPPWQALGDSVGHIVRTVDLNEALNIGW